MDKEAASRLTNWDKGLEKVGYGMEVIKGFLQLKISRKEQEVLHSPLTGIREKKLATER